MERRDSGGPGVGAVVLGAFFEIGALVAYAAASPFLALDDRHGWTRRGRRARGRRELDAGPVVSIADARDLPRAVLEGTLEPAGPLIRVPGTDREVLAWCLWSMDAPAVDFADGAFAAFDLVDASGRAGVRLESAREIPWTLGERTTVAAPPDGCRPPRDHRTEAWYLSWVAPGTRVRASGKLDGGALPGYREGASPATLSPDDDGTPVLLRSLKTR